MERLPWLALVVALLHAASASAVGLVVPSDRVSTVLNVRAAPTTASPVLGHLRPHEVATLVATQPHWYSVRLDDGTQGFVAKGWSRQFDALRIGEWNLKKLGHGTQKNYAAVSHVIASDFDVLAVVEVMQKQQGHPGYDQLMQSLGPQWAGLVTASPRPNDPSDGNAEFYAIVYRTSAVHLCAGWSGLRYVPDGDGHPGETGPDLFAREPAYTCFAVTNTTGTVTTDFLLGAYHARWAQGDQADIVAEVKHVDTAMGAMAASRPGEKDVLLVGDFNLVPEVLDTAVTAHDRTEGTGSTLTITGTRTHNLYDHLLVEDPAASQELVGFNPTFL